MQRKLTVPVGDNVGLDVLQGQMHAVFGVHCRGRSLGKDGQGARLPAVHVGAVVKQHRMRGLRQVRAQAYLISLSAGQGPESGFFASQLGNSSLECLDRSIASGLVIDIVIDSGVKYGLMEPLVYSFFDPEPLSEICYSHLHHALGRHGHYI